MSEVIRLEAIQELLPSLDVVGLMEEAFVAYSEGRSVVPPVGEMIFEDPPGEVHIKYGYIRGGDSYVVKIASGFYDNTKLGLPSSQGLVLLFSQRTGELEAVLLDEGLLTDVRTAAAGAVAAKHLGPERVDCIGVLGAGTQGRLQLEHLRRVTPCRKAKVWSRGTKWVEGYLERFDGSDIEVEVAATAAEVAETCSLIVTTTPSHKPLLTEGHIRPGTHITTVGSDTEEKIELDPTILARADRVVVDSLSQSESRGEVFRAVSSGALSRESVVELGAVIGGRAVGRENDEQVTVCDLTGVAVQDLMIASGVVAASRRAREEAGP